MTIRANHQPIRGWRRVSHGTALCASTWLTVPGSQHRIWFQECTIKLFIIFIKWGYNLIDPDMHWADPTYSQESRLWYPKWKESDSISPLANSFTVSYLHQMHVASMLISSKWMIHSYCLRRWTLFLQNALETITQRSNKCLYAPAPRTLQAPMI